MAVLAGLLWALARTTHPGGMPTASPLTVLAIGQTLMNEYVWPLQAVGVVLTVALVGAVMLVMEDKR
jgi:NADH:ubiquinone oxidoreductase subunit 6 (subunit J)